MYRLGGTILCTHDVFEIFFVVSKQTAPCFGLGLLMFIFMRCDIRQNSYVQLRH
jgi:hypothetical protein